MLSAEVKQRVLSTFRQAIDLFHQGRTDEVLVGCDFLLKLDPMFDPAKRLLEKAKNPSLPIDVDSLLISDEIGGDPLENARQALEERDFQRAVELSTAVLRADLSNSEAQRISEEAQERMEAAPFVAQFLSKARTHLGNNNLSGARAEIEKGKTLDSMHPDLLAVETELERKSAPAAFDFGGSSSFVVDAPPPQQAPTAAPPSSDFGFTFEEEKKPEAFGDGGFSFDGGSSGAATFGGFGSQPEAPSAPASFDSGSFDFATASVDVSEDEQTKIQQYLRDGDTAYESSDYQGAIDIWSRVFLIDVTNDAASERIERARKKRVEIDRQVEELVSAGTTAKNRGDLTTARAKYSEALSIDPQHRDANDAMANLDQQSEEPPAASRPSMIQPVEDDLFTDDFSSSEAAANEGSGSAAPSKSGKSQASTKAAAPSKKLPIGAIAAVIGVLVLAGAGYFGYSKFFGGKSEDASQTSSVLAEAQKLAQRGEFDRAIALLVTIGANDPQHDQALEMIDDLKNKKAAATLLGGRPRQEVFAEMLATGRTAYDARDFMKAKETFEKASSISPLQGDAKTMYDDAAARVAKLDSARVLLKEGNYREALSNLERLLQEDPGNQNVLQLISNARFNLGTIALQEERTADAVAEFDRVLAQAPGDEVAKRSRDLASRYNSQEKDLLYRIYARYLPRR